MVCHARQPARPPACGWIGAILCCLATLAGCGSHSGSGHASAAATGAVDDESHARLAITHAHAEPGGPTTSSTIVLAFEVSNIGEAPTPSQHAHGAYAYLPIVWRIVRDGQVVGQGEILGLMPGDVEPLRVTLAGEPPGDKAYQVVVDPDASLALPEASAPATISVPYGSHG